MFRKSRSESEAATSSFQIDREQLDDDDSWRLKESREDQYRPDDFPIKPLGGQHGNGGLLPLAALGAICIVFSIWVSVRFVDSYIFIGPIHITAFAAIAALIIFVLVWWRHSMSESGSSDRNNKSAKYAIRGNYVSPGYVRFTFFAGNKGILLDGKNFLYFFEWKSVSGVDLYPDKIELTHNNLYKLVIPWRFFSNNFSPKASWDVIKAYVLSHTDHIDPVYHD